MSLNEIKNQNIWSIQCDWICITTNGLLNKNGSAIMGAGLALQAKDKVKGCEIVLGKKIETDGNHVYQFGQLAGGKILVSFPTKNNWRNKSCLKLIEQSCQELSHLWDNEVRLNPLKIPKVCLSKVGCLNGGLDYEKQVRPLLQKYFANEKMSQWFFVCV